MVRYHIRINTGDDNHTTTYYFVHKDWATISNEESDAAFHKAVQELNHVYKDYGRFATSIGVKKLFESFGFEETIAD